MHLLLAFFICNALGFSTAIMLSEQDYISAPRITSPDNLINSPRIVKRGDAGESCSDDEAKTIREAMADCKLYVDRAYYAIKDNDKLRRTFFKTNSDEYITTIQEIY